MEEVINIYIKNVVMEIKKYFQNYLIFYTNINFFDNQVDNCQKNIEKLEIYIKKEKRANKILFILLSSLILGTIGTFVIVSLNYLILIAN